MNVKSGLSNNMKPYYNYENKIILYYGDCLEIMPQLEIKFDCIICDLPYGSTNCKWDSFIDLEKLWIYYKKLNKNNTPIILFGSQPFTSKLIMSNINMFKLELIWNKIHPANFCLAKRMPLKSHENICIFYKDQPVYNPQKIQNKESKLNKLMKKGKHIKETFGEINEYFHQNQGLSYPKSIIKFLKDSVNCSNKERKSTSYHPTQKPLKLIKYLIKTYTNENMLILDNCAGSGTTGIGALQLDRKCIMIEKEKKYCDIIIERIKYAVAEKNNEFYIPEEENYLFK